MDYSKQDGGTRVHDQLKARTLATGHGQSYRAARENGSHRAEKVVAGMKPGQHVSDPGLKQIKVKRDDETTAMAGMDPPPAGPDSVKNDWPLRSGQKGHHQATGQLSDPADNPDQGEQTRVPQTGRKSHGVQIQSSLGKGR